MCVGVCGWVCVDGCVCVLVGVWVYIGGVCVCVGGVWVYIGGVCVCVGGVCVWVVCTSWKVKGLIPHGQRRISVDEHAAVISAETKPRAYIPLWLHQSLLQFAQRPVVVLLLPLKSSYWTAGYSPELHHPAENPVQCSTTCIQ